MNLRFPEINLEKLASLADQTIETLKRSEEKEYFLIIGNPGLRDKRNQISYIIEDKSATNKHSFLIHPEIHKTPEGVFLCECPDFDYKAKTKEQKLSQAISLEIAARLAKKIKGIIIVINYLDLYTARGTAYKNLLKTLSELFNYNFEEVFKSLIFIITNKPENIDINNILKTINANVKMLQEELSYKEDDESQEQNEILIQEKMELAFSELILSHADQFLMIDELDNGKSRKILFESLSKISPIELFKFNFESIYTNLLTSMNFNLKKFIEDTLNKASSFELKKAI